MQKKGVFFIVREAKSGRKIFFGPSTVGGPGRKQQNLWGLNWQDNYLLRHQKGRNVWGGFGRKFSQQVLLVPAWGLSNGDLNAWGETGWLKCSTP